MRQETNFGINWLGSWNFFSLTFKTKNKPLKGLSHEIDFKNVDENGQILALTRAAAGF
jgi:hypothetical protein